MHSAKTTHRVDSQKGLLTAIFVEGRKFLLDVKANVAFDRPVVFSFLVRVGVP